MKNWNMLLIGLKNGKHVFRVALTFRWPEEEEEIQEDKEVITSEREIIVLDP